ncbi:MAG: hypothetical protein MJZ42_05445, partial [Bacteroidales bacterium]|nr:hypothetical protein [Bacteroidales bacterium]
RGRLRLSKLISSFYFVFICSTLIVSQNFQNHSKTLSKVRKRPTGTLPTAARLGAVSTLEKQVLEMF